MKKGLRLSTKWMNIVPKSSQCFPDEEGIETFCCAIVVWVDAVVVAVLP